MLTVLLIVLLLMAVGALPVWPYAANFGYLPSGTLALILIVVLAIALLGPRRGASGL